MKRKLTSGIFALAALLTVSSAFYSCKDYDEELKTDYENQIKTTKTTLENALNTQVGILNDSITALRNTNNSQQNQLNELDADLDEISDDVAALSDSVNDHGTRIGDLEVTVDEMGDAIIEIAGLTDSIAKANNAAIAKVWASVDSIQTDIADVNGKYESILNLIKQMVTSVEVRAVESPVVGSLIFPLDIQSNILAAYYGTTSAAVYFPTAADGVITADEAVKLWNTKEELENSAYKELPAVVMASGATIENTNAGSVYLNVNPSTVDFTGKEFKLVNTQNEEGGITLGELKKSDKVLTFGYSRAEGNQLWEAPATLTDIEKCKFDFADIAQTVVSSLKNSKSTGDIEFKKLASQLQEAMTDLGDVYDVSTSWTDSLGTHYVSAGQNIGEYAVKPLSYKFLEGYTYTGKDVTVNGKTYHIYGIPSLDAIVAKIDNGIDKALNAAKSRIVKSTKGAYVRLYFDLGDANASNLNAAANALSTKYEGAELAKITIAGDSYTAYLAAEEDGAYKYGYIDYPISKIGDKLDNYGITAKAKVDAAADKVAAYYNKVQAFANKVIEYAKTPNTLLQPVALFKSAADQSYYSLSEVGSMPTQLQVVGDTLTIYPTSITSELLAPAYKKYIALIQTAELDSTQKGHDAVEYDCSADCKCHFGATLTDCYYTEDVTIDGVAHKKGEPKYVVGGKYYCHPIIYGELGHEIGDAKCDLTYCTCAAGKCPNKYCKNYKDADGNHYVKDEAVADKKVKYIVPTVVAPYNEVFDGDIRTYKFAGLKAGKYTVIYQCLDYAGNIVTKKYYIEVSK